MWRVLADAAAVLVAVGLLLAFGAMVLDYVARTVG